ncbi:MAG: phosphodiester glycosidase family protein [Christensenellales bacterium]
MQYKKMDPEGILTSVRCIALAPSQVKLVLASRLLLRSVLTAGGRSYPEVRNHIEPYDFLTHVFLLPQDLLQADEPFRLSFDYALDEDAFRARRFSQGNLQFTWEGGPLIDPASLYQASLNGLRLTERAREPLRDGVDYIRSLYLDRQGLPVRTFALRVDAGAADFRVGTPEDGFEARYQRQSVIGQMAAALAKGKPVLAAVNGDFFDMFGDFSPSGPCVKDGRLVWAGDAARPVLGRTQGGGAFIGPLPNGWQEAGQIEQALGGFPWILKDGAPHDLMLGEPFGDLRHPRTAAGLGADGRLILLVVDGRIPDHSNGASLGDLALLMREMGAVSALNLDGGGSAILILNQSGTLSPVNRPADLIRPNDNLIREIYNSLLIVAD